MLIPLFRIRGYSPEYWVVNIFTNARTRIKKRHIPVLELSYHIIDTIVSDGSVGSGETRQDQIYEYIYDHKYTKNETILRTILFKTPGESEVHKYILSDIIKYIRPPRVCLLFMNDVMEYIKLQVDKILRDSNMGRDWRNIIFKSLASNEYLDYNFWVDILTHASNTYELLKNLFKYSKYGVEIYKWCNNPNHWCDPYDARVAILENKYIDAELFETVLFDPPHEKIEITDSMNKTFLYDNLEQIRETYVDWIYWHTRIVLQLDDVYECVREIEHIHLSFRVILYMELLQQLLTKSKYYSWYRQHARLLIHRRSWYDKYDAYTYIIKIDGLTRDAIEFILDEYGDEIVNSVNKGLDDTISILMKQKNIYRKDLDRLKIDFRAIDMCNLLTNPNLVDTFDIADIFNIYNLDNFSKYSNNAKFLSHKCITTEMLEYITPKLISDHPRVDIPYRAKTLNHILCNPNITPELFAAVIEANMVCTTTSWVHIFNNATNVSNKLIIKWFKRFIKCKLSKN